MLAEATIFFNQLLVIILTDKQFQLTSTIYILSIIFSILCRRSYKTQFYPISAALDSHVATHFKLTSSTPLKLTANLYRTAGTNFGQKSSYRSFRMISQFPSSSNLIQKLLDYALFIEPTSTIQLVTVPLTQNLYGALISQNKVSAAKSAFSSQLCWFQPSKQQIVPFQTYESYPSLAQNLKIENADFVIYANGELTVQCAIQHTEKVLASVFEVAKKLIELQTTLDQQKQIDKNTLIAKKYLSQQKSQQQQIAAGENFAKKIAGLERKLQSKSLRESDRKAIQTKLESIQKKEKAKAAKKMQNQMGMGQQQGGGKVVMK
ncbi:hypothetical protein SS50377_21203 [Spironucleus salmonicida]|uniref:Uncharacterized protein n=1 Tax=Spironucleus salmonicida TaxID=348837 RepID=V6LHF3_9EUKA|nr:hypothetical protein SS50377_21203 [Spironucleus salmonicida]|eukprot:EST43977.1 hypothetical protein SS50377_16285 [Spironucleus salmonicida]